MQVAVNRAADAAFVVGVDLSPIRPIRGALSLKEDITATARCGTAVRKLMDSRGVAAFDVVLHDGVPRKKKRGNRSLCGDAAQDAATTHSTLIIKAVRIATMFLAPKGTFITKFIRGQNYNAIMFCLKQLFEDVHLSKPAASRSTSSEMYFICVRYKAPATIQPELLDLKHLHLLSVDAEKRKMERYPERYGSTECWKAGLASDFIWSEAQTPQEFLDSCFSISFDDPASLPIKKHELTTNAIKHLCEHFYMLGEDCFSHILKWRIRIRKALSSCSQVTPKADGTEAEAKVKDGNKLLQEEDELTSIIDRKRMREKRQSRPCANDKACKASIMQIYPIEDGYGDPDLFPVCTIKNKETQTHEDFDDEMDCGEDQQRSNPQLERMIVEAFEPSVTENGGEVKHQIKRAKRIIPYANTDMLRNQGRSGQGRSGRVGSLGAQGDKGKNSSRKQA